MPARLTLSLLLVNLLIHSGYRITTAELLIRPRDTEALVDFPTFFNCASTIRSEIQWFHYPDGDNKQRHLVYGYGKFYPPYDTRYRVEKDENNGVYNLVINKVTANDFGKYQCQDDFGRGASASCQLIVLESQPICESNMNPEGVIVPNVCSIEPEDLQLACTISFRGAIPSMVWTKTGSETAITQGVSSNISTNRAVYELTFKPKSSDDGRSFECRTTKGATVEFGCTSEIIKTNGSNVPFLVVCSLLFVVFVLWIVSLGLYIKLRIETREKALRKDPKYEQVELIGQPHDESEYERLTEKVSDLEKIMYCTEKIEYSSIPDFIKTTNLKKEKLAIKGIAILNGELAAVYEKSPEVDIYDTLDLRHIHSIILKSLWDPQDIASCKINTSLYIVHQTRDEKTCQILRLDAKDKTVKCYWSIDCRIARLSTHETNVIVCAPDQKRIIEYSPEGAKLHIVPLSPEYGFDHIWYAMKVTGTHFLVSHQETKSKRHMLSLLDNSGKVFSSTEHLAKDLVDTPICFTEDRNKSVLVLSSGNSRPTIVLLSKDLMQPIKTLRLSENSEKVYGARLCLEETASHLFVAANEGDPSKNLFYDGRISMYSFCKRKSEHRL